MDRAQNPKGKAVKGRSREDIDVGDYSESDEEEEKNFTAVEETLSMSRFYSESSFTYPVEEYKEMFKEAMDAIIGLQKRLGENAIPSEPSPLQQGTHLPFKIYYRNLKISKPQ
ncbi:hypothetical protein K3495_g12424 [Podosphaera aphanis]|nr:hypothetical protein K3495_g12424 [Podosphaera aphanis]